jgi:hypothetical protein
MPLPGSLVSWRAVYVEAGNIHVDGIQVPWWGAPLVKPGGATRLATFAIVPHPMAERDGTRWVFEVFKWFADGLIAPVEGAAPAIGDMRYGADASSLEPLWGLQFDVLQGDTPTRWRSPTSTGARIINNIWRSLIGDDPGYQPLHDMLKIR